MTKILWVTTDTDYVREMMPCLDMGGGCPAIAGDIREMRTLLRKHPCDLLIIPVSANLDCVAVQKKARQIRPEIPILVLTDRNRAVEAILQCLDLLRVETRPAAQRKSTVNRTRCRPAMAVSSI